MSQQVNVQQAKASLSQLLTAAESGERVVIARRGQPVVQLTPIRQQTERILGFIPGAVSDEVLAPLSADELALWE